MRYILFLCLIISHITYADISLTATVRQQKIYAEIPLPLAFFTAGIPIVGTFLGMSGAVHAWDWSWTSAFLLFCGPFIVVFSIAGIATFLENSR